MEREQITKAVRVLLHDLTNIPEANIDLEDDLVRNLRLDGDDFSYEFVPPLETAIGVKTTQADWDTVRTVGDVVELFAKKSEETALSE